MTNAFFLFLLLANPDQTLNGTVTCTGTITIGVATTGTNLSWSSLTPTQWANLTPTQWSNLTP
jgi:hypothetical protein